MSIFARPSVERQRFRTTVESLRILARCSAIFAVIIATAEPASAEVTRIEIQRREPLADGYRFGRSGSYEKIVGRVTVELDPSHPANAVITDLELAPRNARGKVEFWSDFCLLQPTDPERGNRRLLYDVNNRGNKLALRAFNEGPYENDPSTLEHLGNGFLMRRGYSVLWCGWNGDIVPDGRQRLLIDAPVARHKDGSPLTGKIHVEICRNEKVFSQPFYWGRWGNSAAYPAVSTDNRNARLTMRPHRGAKPTEVPRDGWAFARLEDGQPVPDPTHLYVKDGIRPGWLYDLVYVGRDPRVTGVGLAAVRDVAAFFRYAKADNAQLPNPAAGAIEKAVIFGISQSGRFIRHFLYEGFNTDLRGRMVFDGAMIHVAGGGKGYFNHRFFQTTLHGSQHQDNLATSELFPFNTVPQIDPVTDRRGDMLRRARAANHVPKIFFTQTSTEYWTRGASLLHTDVQGKRDVPLDENVRLYLVAGAHHLDAAPPERGNFQNVQNTLKHRPYVLRALLVAMDQWISTERQPPQSRYPRIDDRTLVDLATYQRNFPKIPGVEPPRVLYRPLRLDFGPRWLKQHVADFAPAKSGTAYRTLVPAVDGDGTDLAGIRLPAVQVPVGTYTGWNLRSADIGATDMLARWSGSFIPFVRTEAQRRRASDPRLSILERYPTREDYIGRIAEATISLQRQRFLLAEDVVAIIAEAATRDYWSQTTD